MPFSDQEKAEKEKNLIGYVLSTLLPTAPVLSLPFV